MAAAKNNSVNFFGPVGTVNTGNVVQNNYFGAQMTGSAYPAPGTAKTSAETGTSDAFQNVRQFLNDRFSVLKKYQDKLSTDTNSMSEEKGTRDEFLNKLRKCSLIFVTANDCEKKMAMQFFYQQNGKRALWFRAVDQYSIQLGSFAGIPTAHIHPTKYGSGAAEELGCWLLKNHIYPKLLVSVGVAYGMYPGSQKLGDVLFSSRVIDMDAPQKITDGDIILSYESIYRVGDHCTAAWKAFCENEPGWYWGTMLSKNVVLSDTRMKQKFLRAAEKIDCKDVIGGEMEYAGFFRAAKSGGGDLSRIIGIKGICDWGEQKNSYGEAAKDLPNVTIKDNNTLKDLSQCFAAERALKALAELIEKRGSVLE